MIIFINGKEVQLSEDIIELTFEEICKLSGMPEYSTVLFTRRNIIPQNGTVLKGQSIKITSGINIDCVPTGNA